MPSTLSVKFSMIWGFTVETLREVLLSVLDQQATSTGTNGYAKTCMFVTGMIPMNGNHFMLTVTSRHRRCDPTMGDVCACTSPANRIMALSFTRTHHTIGKQPVAPTKHAKLFSKVSSLRIAPIILLFG